MKLSVVISAHNEEGKIENCLKSVKDLADEIVFVDNQSTDKTASIAKKYTKSIYNRPNKKMLNINKNFGISKAKGAWILILDADEKVSSQLAAEINNIVNTHPYKDAYKIPRKNIIFGKWIRHTGWYPDFQTRLFQKENGKFEEKHNHEQLTVKGEVGSLQSPIIHDHYKSIDEFLHKTFFSYTKNEADNLIKKGYKFKTQDLLKMPFNEFISRYFARQGYKDGRHGLALSLLMTFYHLIIVLRVWEKEKFEEKEKDTRTVLQTTVKEMKKELKHWITEVGLKKMSPIRQTIERAKRKLA